MIMKRQILTEKEKKRYLRHLALPEVGLEGQKRLKKANILIAGVGGLGSPASLYLAASGIGTLGLIDFDRVEENNLQRQVIYSMESVGKPKAESAKENIQKLNPHVKVKPYNDTLNSRNAPSIIKEHDVVLDCTDNFTTRYIINDASVKLKKPLVYGSIYRFEGQCSVFNYNDGPCLRCAFPKVPDSSLIPSCVDDGILGVTAGVIGSLQATEALKIILNKGNVLSGRLLLYNALSAKFEEIMLKRNKSCVCDNY